MLLLMVILCLYLLVDRSATAVHEKGFNFDDARIMRGAWRNEPNPEACMVDTLDYLRNSFYSFLVSVTLVSFRS